jgi:tetratricopeptide (TPR) repeat protein
LGIPHPPGYPLHTLLGHVFSWLPLGRYPFRINLLSAVFAASVCALLYGFLRQSFKVAPRLALPLALLWTVGATTYPAALSAKTGIYLLTTLFLIAILWALFENRLGFAAFLLGLSLANHWMTMSTFLPGLGVLFYGRWKEGTMDRRRIFQYLSFALLGFSVYLFLPLRASLNPWLNWGNPSTWHNFIFDFLRSQYTTVSGGGFSIRLQQGWTFLKSVFLEFAGFFLAALWGLGKVYARNKTRVWALGLLWLGLSAGVVFVLGVPEDQLYLIRNYVIPIQAFTLLFAAWGLQTALDEREEGWRKRAEKILAGALVLLLAGLGIWRVSRDRQTDYTINYDYALNGFKNLPRNSIYFCKGDPVVFPSWYFQWVEGKRPDVAVIGVDGLPMEWVRRNLALFHPGLKTPRTYQLVGVESIPSLAKWIVDQNPTWPLYFSYNEAEDVLFPGVKLVPYGLTEKGCQPGQEAVLDEGLSDFIWAGLRLRHLKEPGFPVDPKTEMLLVRDYAVFRNNLGVYYEDLADDAKARMTPHSGAADLLRLEGLYQKCLAQFQWSQQWEPKDAQFNYNLGNAYYDVGRLTDAMGCYEKATRLKPDYTKAYFNWAVTALQTGHYPEAKELFAKVLKAQPDNAQAQQGLDLLNKMNP